MSKKAKNPSTSKSVQKKEQSSEDIAKAMAANMKANMEDPDFIQKEDERNAEAAKEALKKHHLHDDDEK